MTDESAAVGAPGLIMVKDESYLMSPLTPRDYVELSRYLKAQCETQSPLAAISASLKDLPPEFQAEAIRAAVALHAGTAKGAKTEPTREAIFAMSQELPGVRYQFWLSCRKNHPELTLAKAGELVDESNSDDVIATALEVNGQGKTDDPKANGRAG
jgi:hypothetical protein